MPKSMIKKGMLVQVKEYDYISKPYKVVACDERTVTIEVTPPIRLRKGYNLQMPINKILNYE